jgi:hypothetical protein
MSPVPISSATHHRRKITYRRIYTSSRYQLIPLAIVRPTNMILRPISSSLSHTYTSLGLTITSCLMIKVVPNTLHFLSISGLGPTVDTERDAFGLGLRSGARSSSELRNVGILLGQKGSLAVEGCDNWNSRPRKKRSQVKRDISMTRFESKSWYSN